MLKRLLNQQATRQAIDKNVVDAESAAKTFQAKVVDDTSGYNSGSRKREIMVEFRRVKPAKDRGKS